MRGRLILLLFALLLVLNLGGLAVHETYRDPGPLQTSRIVVIPPAGTTAAAETLRADGAISYPLIFHAATWITRRQGPIRAGEFSIPARASLWQILFILRFGAPVQHHVTFPEGLTGFQIGRILNNAAAASGSIAAPPEGSILPQTYDYVLGTPRSKILARAALALQNALQAAWPRRNLAIPLRTAEQAVILASIVQEETPLPQELPQIAAVYENRLSTNMRLQADPTVIYAASNGATAAGLVLTRADIANTSRYNTYANPGLPPGPICAPGMAAINAVLHPARSNNLYFVATGAGGHVFAATYPQQLANIALYWHPPAPSPAPSPAPPPAVSPPPPRHATLRHAMLRSGTTRTRHVRKHHLQHPAVAPPGVPDSP